MKKIFISLVFIINYCYGQIGAPIVQQAVKSALNSPIVWIGNSITYNGENDFPIFGIATSYNYMATGFSSFANVISKSGWQQPIGGNLGVPGDQTSNVIARLGKVITLNPKVVVLEIGTNDVAGNDSANAIEANIQIILSALKAINTKIVVLTILNRYFSAAFNANQTRIQGLVNAWLLTQADNVNIFVASVTTIFVASMCQSDGIHPNEYGSYAVGNIVGDILSPLVVPIKTSDNIFPNNSYTANPLMNGSAGTTDGSASGTVASNWELIGANAGGATVVGSLTNDALGNQEQVITLSGTYSGINKQVALSYVFTSPGVNVGDNLEGVLDFEILSPLTGVGTINFQLQGNDASFNLVGQACSFSRHDSSSFSLPVGRYTMRTPIQPFLYAPQYLTSQVTIQLKDSAAASSAVAASIKIWKAGIRKVTFSSATNGSSFTRQVITSGTSGTVTGGNYVVNINPASLAATYTLTMPASPSDLQEVEIHFGGTITTGIVVTSFTLLANSGQTFKDGAVPTATNALAADYYIYRWYNATSEWERKSQ